MHAQPPPENKSPRPLAGGTEAGIAMNSDGNTTIPSHAVQCFRLLLAAATDKRLSRSSIACLGLIVDRYNRQQGAAWPGLNRLATEANIHRSNAIRAIALLEECGYLQITTGGQGKSNRYRPAFQTSSASATSSVDATSSASATKVVAPTRLQVVAPARPEPTYITYPRNLPKKATCVSAPADRFDEFWAAYPRKEGSKEKARKSWARQSLDSIADVILADIAKRKQSHPSWHERRFILHPTTYLNGQRWEDEWEPAAHKPSAADNFEGKTYVGTPIDQLPPELRAGLERQLAEFRSTASAGGGKRSAVERVKAANAAAEQREQAIRGPSRQQTPAGWVEP